MPFIPHTDRDTEEMLALIGAPDIDALFDEMPPELRSPGLEGLPEALGEADVSRLVERRASRDPLPLCFLGAGAYEHHIPAAVWEIATRGEFYSAYTPYQAEASQGTLQVIYEYQTMMASLTALDVSNASLYDGATALAEAVLMALRARSRSRSKRVLLPRSLHPHYAQVVRTITASQDVEFVTVPYDPASGRIDMQALDACAGEDVRAIVIAQPNVFGILEDADALADWARSRQTLVIGAANPLSLALLKPPGEWGAEGAAIACGEGQPLGVPLSCGGPYFGFLCCRQELVRQLPGRLVGRTLDVDGSPGFTLTLQAREQHIRRSRATSNICTNQGLMVTAATIYMSLLGPVGLKRTAALCHRRTALLLDALTEIRGVERVFAAPFFHETVVRLPADVERVLGKLAEVGILGGFALRRWFPELGDALLVCATETKTEADIHAYARALREAVQAS
jgi:glycine dehydrogenase subunit 1